MEDAAESVSSGDESENDSSVLEADGQQQQVTTSIKRKRKRNAGKGAPNSNLTMTDYFNFTTSNTTSGGSQGTSSAKVAKSVQGNRSNKSQSRQVQQDLHYCVYKNCLKSLSRGNQYNRLRHKNNNHENDKDFDMCSHILPENHKTVQKLLKKKKMEDASKSGKGAETSDPRSSSQTTDNTEIRHDEVERDVSGQMNNEDEAIEEEGVRGVRELGENDEARRSVLSDSSTANISHLSEDALDLQRDFELPPEDVGLGHSSVQDTLHFAPARLNSPASKQKPTEITSDDLRAVHQKLDVLLENTNTSICSKITQENVPEAIDSLDVLKKASNITDINGSGVSFYQGNDDSDAIVR